MATEEGVVGIWPKLTAALSWDITRLLLGGGGAQGSLDPATQADTQFSEVLLLTCGSHSPPQAACGSPFRLLLWTGVHLAPGLCHQVATPPGSAI